MSGLEGLLNQATAGPWYVVVNDLVGGYMVATDNRPASEQTRGAGVEVADFVNQPNGRLVALAPETTAWAIKAAARLRFVRKVYGSLMPDDEQATIAALLDEFDRLQQKADGRLD